MTSYGFSFRASLRKGEHQGVLYLRVVRGGLSRSVTTPYHVWPHEWNRTEKKLIISQKDSERASQLAEYESSMQSDLQRMERVVRELEKKGDYSIDDIMYHYNLRKFYKKSPCLSAAQRQVSLPSP